MQNFKKNIVLYIYETNVTWRAQPQKIRSKVRLQPCQKVWEQNAPRKKCIFVRVPVQGCKKQEKMVALSVHVVLGSIYSQGIYVTTAGTQILWDNFLTASHCSYCTLVIERGFFFSLLPG